jgi:hypothetical protein
MHQGGIEPPADRDIMATIQVTTTPLMRAEMSKGLYYVKWTHTSRSLRWFRDAGIYPACDLRGHGIYPILSFFVRPMSYPLRLPTSEPILTLTNRMYPSLQDYNHLTSSQAKRSLWIIELHNGEDSRLTATLVDQAFRPALDVVERHWREQWRAAKDAKDDNAGGGALIIVGKRNQHKFFSNGASYIVLGYSTY